MTTWEAERDDIGWSIVKVTNGTREEVRSRWCGMDCITAQVIAKELNSAWRLGVKEGAKTYRDALSLETLGD